MTEYGKVGKCTGKFAVVRIGRNSACGSCGKCGMSEKMKHVDFYVENVCSAKEGDTVELEITDKNPAGMAAVAYLIPLLPGLALLLTSIALKWPDYLSALLFFAGFALGFVAVALIDRRKKHKWIASPKMLSIVTPKEIGCNPTALQSEKERINE